MRQTLTASLIAFLLATAPAMHAPAQDAQDPGATAGAPSRFATADELLLALEDADNDLDALEAEIRYVRFFVLAGDRQLRDGRLAFERTDDGRRFSIRFDRLMVGPRVENEEKLYIFDGEWLVEKLPEQKLFIKRQMARPGDSFDPLKLGEGPLPLPIGQKRDDIVRRFSASLPERTDGLEFDSLKSFTRGCVQLRLVPLPHHEDQTEFAEIRLWYDQDTLLPRLAVTEDADGDTSTVQLLRVRTNSDAEIGAADFSVEPPAAGSGWDVQIEPWRERGPRRGASAEGDS
ncbi:MAG: hypothetical protein AAGG07_00075 [Planctomycetota bacterium]